MKRIFLPIIGLLLVVTLVACGPEKLATQSVRAVGDDDVPSQTPELATVVDEQGAVRVAITPLDLSADAPAVEF